MHGHHSCLLCATPRDISTSLSSGQLSLSRLTSASVSRPVTMTTMNAPSLLPLEMSRHLHRPPPGLLPPLQPARSPPPPNFGLCAMTTAGVGGRASPTARPRSSSTSLMALAGDKQAGSGGGGSSFLGFHGAPTAANSADNNTCRLIDYRNAQVAAFHVSQQIMVNPLSTWRLHVA